MVGVPVLFLSFPLAPLIFVASHLLINIDSRTLELIQICLKKPSCRSSQTALFSGQLLGNLRSALFETIHLSLMQLS